MPKFDSTISISVIVAFAAIISPIFTAIINNRYLLKQKKLELKHKEYEQTTLYKRHIFENYLKSLGQIAHLNSSENINFYSEYYPLAYMYASIEVQHKMSEANQLITAHSYRQAIPYIDELSILVSNELKKL